MKGIVASFLFVIVWAIVSHFIPLVWLTTSWIFFPAVFVVLSRLNAYAPLSYYVVAPYSLVLILISDLLFREYGAGNCDQVGSVLVGMSFVATLVVADVILIHVSNNIYAYNKGIDRLAAKSQLKIVLYALAMLLLVFALASVIEPEINLWWRQYLSLAL